MTLGGDNAFGHFHFTRGANQLAGAGTGNVTGLTHGSGHADGTGIGQGKLHLGGGADGSKDTNALQGVLGSDNIHLLFAGELSGLAQPALDGQLMACAEQGLEIFLGNMHVTGRSFNQNLFHGICPSFCSCHGYRPLLLLQADHPNTKYSTEARYAPVHMCLRIHSLCIMHYEL